MQGKEDNPRKERNSKDNVINCKQKRENFYPPPPDNVITRPPVERSPLMSDKKKYSQGVEGRGVDTCVNDGTLVDGKRAVVVERTSR